MNPLQAYPELVSDIADVVARHLAGRGMAPPAAGGPPGGAGAALPASAADADYPEVMREIADVVARHLAELGVDGDRALAIGEAAAEAVREHHGGTLLYLPKGHTMKTRRRWAAIWDEFTGANHEALALKHGVNVKAVYKILAVMRAEQRARQQPGLFDTPAAKCQQGDA